MLEKFSDRARKALQQARTETKEFNHEYVGTEHLLLALLKGDGVACNVLRNLDIDYCTVKKEISKIVQPGPDVLTPPDSRLPYTPRTENVLRLACDESSRFGHNYVGTEHLLLGLMREPEGVAYTVLKNLDLDLSMIVKEISDLLGTDELQKVSIPERKKGDILKELRSLIMQQSILVQRMLTILSKE